MDDLGEIRLELIILPVTDVDRAKAFYADQFGFHVDYDQRVNESLRFVQLTPPGSACSIAIGEGLTDATPGFGSRHAGRRAGRGGDAPRIARARFRSGPGPGSRLGSLPLLLGSRRERLGRAAAARTARQVGGCASCALRLACRTDEPAPVERCRAGSAPARSIDPAATASRTLDRRQPCVGRGPLRRD